MKYFIISFLFACAFAKNITDFHPCDSPDGNILSVDITPCEPTFDRGKYVPGSCKLYHNTTATITVDFKTKVNTTKVSTIVHGIMPSDFVNAILSLVSHDGQKGLKFEGVDTDACANNHVNHCNITRGETLTYTNALFVQPIYPQVRLTVKWEIRDDQNRNLVCLLIPAEVV